MEVQGVTLAYRRLCVIIRRLGYSLRTPHLRGPRHLGHDGQQNVGGGHVGDGLDEAPDDNINNHHHRPGPEGEPLLHELPVHQRGRHAGPRLGGEGPEAELGGEDEEEEDGQHRVIHHLALRHRPARLLLHKVISPSHQAMNLDNLYCGIEL